MSENIELSNINYLSASVSSELFAHEETARIRRAASREARKTGLDETELYELATQKVEDLRQKVRETLVSGQVIDGPAAIDVYDKITGFSETPLLAEKANLAVGLRNAVRHHDQFSELKSYSSQREKTARDLRAIGVLGFEGVDLLVIEQHHEQASSGQLLLAWQVQPDTDLAA